jgi:hypothetical protein
VIGASANRRAEKLKEFCLIQRISTYDTKRVLPVGWFCLSADGKPE